MSELKLQQCLIGGRYEISESLGGGSYAEVYLARDALGGAPNLVVIKALNLALRGTLDEDLERTLVENFQNEAIALDRLRHPNIVNLLGQGEALDLAGRQFLYLVLEYLPGGDMARFCRRHPLSIERALYYLEQICDGLAYAHARGVIHRDIKPQNLLLTADQQTVKITDFGVAKFATDDGTITRVGTEVYAAPEHHPLAQTGALALVTDSGSFAKATIKRLTPAADIYSLAKTVYMLLTGDAPRRFALKPITELPPELESQAWATAVLRVLRRATASDPQSRYQTMSEFWEAFRHAAANSDFEEAANEDEETHFQQTTAQHNKSGWVGETSAAKTVWQTNEPRANGISNAFADGRHIARDRIVVPFEEKARADKPGAAANKNVSPRVKASSRWRSAVVGALLFALFFGMLFATAKYISDMRRQNNANNGGNIFGANKNGGVSTPINAPPIVTPSNIGREFVTTTDVNVRSAPNASAPKTGLAEKGSRVRVLDIRQNWCEIVILQHGRNDGDPDSANQGWINGKFLQANGR